jgi:hypothetical protein
MRLDPFRAISPADSRLTLKRAACVLQMLEAMNQAAGRTNPYGAVVERLRKEWQDAVELATATRIEDDARQDLEDSTLAAEEVDHVGRVADFVAKTFGRGRGFPAPGWEVSREWATKLKKDGGASIQPSPVDLDLRYVPNAAWRLRLETDDFEEVKKAARAAVSLWDRLERELSEKSTPSWGPIDTSARGTKRLRDGKPGASDGATAVAGDV